MRDIDVLVVEEPGAEHGADVIAALRARGCHAVRYNLTDLRTVPLNAQPRSFDLYIDGDWQRVSSHTTVWWRRAGSVDTSGLDDEESRLAWDEAWHVLRGGLEAAHPRWVDDPAQVERAELKLHQLRIADALGVMRPSTVVTSDPGSAEAFAPGGTLVVKALSPGTGIAPFVDEVAVDDLDRVAALPALLQQRVDAVADLRVVTVGSRAWTWRRTRERSTTDWRAVDPLGGAFHRIDDSELERTAVELTAALGLSMSVQDWLETESGHVFLEANPQGAWLFLEGAPEQVTPAVASHLMVPPETKGKWPRAIKRFGWDFFPKGRAPENDGVVAPTYGTPTWTSGIADPLIALDVARRAHEQARAGARIAEEKATRLVQVALALLTITIALAAYQFQVAFTRSAMIWLPLVIPVVAALFFLALAAFEALEIDRVGMYSRPVAEDLVGVDAGDATSVVVAQEDRARRLAEWTSRNKHSDLMQARAWFSRGLGALLIAGILAAGAVATTTDSGSTEAPPATPSTTAVL